MSKQGAVLATKKSARRDLVGATTVGVDLGDQWSHYCILDEDGEITEEGRRPHHPGSQTDPYPGRSSDGTQDDGRGLRYPSSDGVVAADAVTAR
jgi:hypothetical protein